LVSPAPGKGQQTVFSFLGGKAMFDQSLYRNKHASPLPKEKKSDHEKSLDREEFGYLLASTKNPSSPHSNLAYNLFWFLGNFGLRISETLDLRFDDFKFLQQYGEFTARRLKKRQEVGRKGKKKVFAPVVKGETIILAPEEAQPLLSMVQRRKEQVKEDRLFPISKRTAQYLFTWYAADSGLLERKPRLSIHSLRHTCGKILYEDTGDLEFVRKRLGHESLRTCSVYVQLSSKKQLEYGSKRAIIT
jgi:integrase